MDGQLTFDMVRITDPDTSRAAAELAAQTAPTLRARCLDAIDAAGPGGMTDFELAAVVGRQQTSAGVRRKELVQMGLVVATSMRRPTPSGATAIVWIAARFAAVPATPPAVERRPPGQGITTLAGHDSQAGAA